MDKFLSDTEVNELIERINSGENEAWEKLYKNYVQYIHKCCWKRIEEFDMTDSQKNALEEDLHMAGLQGFCQAVKNYESSKGKFLTYATYYINGEISKELNVLLNPLGLTERPKQEKKKREDVLVKKVSLEAMLEIQDRKPSAGNIPKLLEDSPDRGDYSAERRALQILDILKKLTDDKHRLSKDELMNQLRTYRIAKYDNGAPLEKPNTVTKTLESILMELDPLEYNGKNDEEYRVKYVGYQEDRLRKKINKDYSGKAPNITGFSYEHMFSDSQLDQLIAQVCFSDMISSDEKTKLIGKLVGTASEYYHTPFWDGEKMKFNPKAVHGRFSRRNSGAREQVAENVKKIQHAINQLAQIRFKFNRYTDDKRMVSDSEYIRVLSPYHLVVYHDNYYCIGLKAKDKKIWHYRVDLMSDVEIVKDENGEIIPIVVSNIEGLPIFNASWDPEKYMAEHLNMAYDEPQDIRIKIRNDDYTIIHDWFGDHYEKMEELIGKDEEGKEVVYDIVKIRTSPFMIVHWAMQYGARVEIMDEDIREKIREEIGKMRKVYDKKEL